MRRHRRNNLVNRGSKKALCSCGALLAFVCFAPFAFAQAVPSPIYVTLRLAPECQGASDFAPRLLSRTHRLRWANPGEPGIVFDVAAGPVQGGFVGQLQIQELDGRYTQRSVEGMTCESVINALAFVAAVLVDPESEQAVEPAPAPPALQVPQVPQVPNAPSRASWSAPALGIGVTAGVTSATSPGLLQPNLGLRATLAWDAPGFSPWITVGLDQRFSSTQHSTFDAASTQAIDTKFGGWAAHFALSPIRWPGEGHTFLRPVGLFEIGQLTSSPSHPQNVAPSAEQTRRWMATGVGVSAEARIVAPVAAVADLGLLFPINRWQFYYTTVGGESHPFDVPSVGLGARLGLIFKFE